VSGTGVKKALARRGAEAKGAAARTRSIALRDGGRVRLSAGPEGDTLRVVSGDGEVRVEVFVTREGTVLRLAGPSVSIETSGAFAVRCASFDVRAEQISLGATGDVALAAGRGLEIHAGHDTLVSAQAVKVEARRGELALQANDDVALNGERVLLNCPTDAEVERRTRESATLKDLLELPFRAPGDPRRLPASAPVEEEQP
jgi:uncharacterized protein (DUF2345 family)